MLGLLFIAVTAPLLAIVLLRVLALRAIPLCAGVAVLWTIGASTANWASAAIAGLFASTATAALLNWMRNAPVVGAGAVLFETVAGVALATLFVFAVFYSSGVRGTPLAIALASSAGLALLTSLQQQRAR